MRIKNKLFPYPILHNEIFSNNYDNSGFELSLNVNYDDEFYILEDLKVEFQNKDLKYLVENGLAKCVCILECPLCMYRKTFEISTTPNTYKFNLFDLNGKIEISAFMYATKDIKGFESSDFEEFYHGYKFDIDKFSIIAIDNGLKQRLEYQNKNDNKKSSIFVLISDLDEDARTSKWTYDENLIKISVPKLQHSEYETIKSIPLYKNVFLSTFAVTPLSFILADFIKSERQIADLECDYKWFKAFMDSYEKVFNERLTDEEFLKMDNVSIYSVVQEIFEYCVIDSVDDLFKICNEGLGDTDED